MLLLLLLLLLLLFLLLLSLLLLLLLLLLLNVITDSNLSISYNRPSLYSLAKNICFVNVPKVTLK